MNLTFQVRDGIISHDGEVHNTRIIPQWDKTEEDIKNYIKVRNRDEHVSNWMPATLEGAVVRISDTIAYIGQDIEDAIRFNILKREEIPKDCAEYLGYRNGEIVENLGIVKGNTIRARNIGRDIIAGLKNIIGGEIEEYTKLMAESREQALDRLVEDAERVGADAVVGINFSTSYIMGNAAEILAYGTAVKLKK
jgi:uncharacterized protein YbjQ (UPF0145 family)